MRLREMIGALLRKNGYALVRFPIMRMLRQIDINVVLDVGANSGQYALELRGSGYTGKIISFEPMAEAYAQLEAHAARDPKWHTVNVALGADDDTATLNIAGNSASSSLLDMLPAHVRAAPQTAYVRTEEIRIRPLDAVYSEFCGDGDRVLLKCDTQGYEREVLQGAAHAIRKIDGLDFELSLVPLYENGPLAEEMISLVRSLGFVPYWINHGFRDPSTQQLLQIDGLFVRRKWGPLAGS